MQSAELGRVVDYFKRPSVILKCICLLCAIVVFGCINHGGYQYDLCLYRADNNACGYGLFVSILALVGAIAGLLTELLMRRLATLHEKRILALSELIFAGSWTFLWFVAFCYLTNRWANSPWFSELAVPAWKYDNVRAAIAFSFFSIPAWGVLTWLCYQQYRDCAEVGGFFASGDPYVGRQQLPGSTDNANEAPYDPYAPYQQQGVGKKATDQQGFIAAEQAPPYYPQQPPPPNNPPATLPPRDSPY